MSVIPSNIYNIVWNTYVGINNKSGICFCCESEHIYNGTVEFGYEFKCGMVLNILNGGTIIIPNLRPICKSCFRSLQNLNMTDLKKMFGFSFDLFNSIQKNNNVLISDPKKLFKSESEKLLENPFENPFEIPSNNLINTSFENPFDEISNILPNDPSNISSNVPSNVPSNIQSNVPFNDSSNVPSNIQSNVPFNDPSNVPSNIQSNVPSNISSDIDKQLGNIQTNFKVIKTTNIKLNCQNVNERHEIINNIETSEKLIDKVDNNIEFKNNNAFDDINDIKSFEHLDPNKETNENEYYITTFREVRNDIINDKINFKTLYENYNEQIIKKFAEYLNLEYINKEQTAQSIINIIKLSKVQPINPSYYKQKNYCEKKLSTEKVPSLFKIFKENMNNDRFIVNTYITYIKISDIHLNVRYYKFIDSKFYDITEKQFEISFIKHLFLKQNNTFNLFNNNDFDEFFHLLYKICFALHTEIIKSKEYRDIMINTTLIELDKFLNIASNKILITNIIDKNNIDLLSWLGLISKPK